MDTYGYERPATPGLFFGNLILFAATGAEIASLLRSVGGGLDMGVVYARSPGVEAFARLAHQAQL